MSYVCLACLFDDCGDCEGHGARPEWGCCCGAMPLGRGDHDDAGMRYPGEQ